MDVDPQLGAVRVDEIYSFVVLAEELHYGHAAQRLRVSRGGLSRRITHLERALGDVLVQRTTRAVRLTPEGQLFLRTAKSVVLQLHAFRWATVAGPVAAMSQVDTDGP